MKLMIVESPNKIAKIRECLPGVKVVASVGHVADMPTEHTGPGAVLGSLGKIVGVTDQLRAIIEPTARGKQQLAKLKADVAQAEMVYLATDPDREGEAISANLREFLRLPKGKYCRVTFNAITKPAIQAAISTPREIDEALVTAQEARRSLDRIIGFGVSGNLRKVSGAAYSAGRVQSPAVRIVVDRQREIESFKPTKHFGAILSFDGGKWTARWKTKPFLKEGQEYILDRELAARAAACRDVTVKSAESAPKPEAPPAPYTTSALFQDASNKLNFNSTKAAELAQKLFEGGHITYHRTDSPNMSKEGIDALWDFAATKSWPVAPKPRVWPSKENSQEGHEAIRPTHFEELDCGATADEKALYRLIWRRAVASQLADAKYRVTTLELEGRNGPETFLFGASGRVLIEPGWRVALENGAETEAEDEEDEKDENVAGGKVPLLERGQGVRADSGRVEDKTTKPPPYFTEASLIKRMEDLGIGRPSTIPTILRRIIERSYVKGQGKKLIATDDGKALVDTLKSRFQFIELDYTKKLEDLLDEIATGKTSYDSVVRQATIELQRNVEGLSGSAALKPKHACPDCSAPLNRLPSKTRRGEYFWVCTSPREDTSHNKFFPDVKGEPGPREQQAAASEHKCPECGAGLVRRESRDRRGEYYWACTSPREDTSHAKFFPDVKGAPGSRETQAAASPHKCPECGAGLVRRESRDKRGEYYWACSSPREDTSHNKFFPDDNGKPGRRVKAAASEVHKCPECGAGLLRRESRQRPGQHYWMCSALSNKDAPPHQRKFLDEANGAPKFN